MIDNKVILNLDACHVEYLVERLIEENQSLHARYTWACDEVRRLESQLNLLRKLGQTPEKEDATA